jgi:hypothetical protein
LPARWPWVYTRATMKCPHCRESYFESFKHVGIGLDSYGDWTVSYDQCPSCKKFIFVLKQASGGVLQRRFLVWPKGSLRAPAPKEVPPAFASDYQEACAVLPDSAKASAALSRRCLQNLLREVAKVKPSDLFNEIQELLGRGAIPSHMADGLDAVRNIGNFAAHPIKSQHSGEVLDVEPGEAEWNLDVLESLFDFYFVQPAQLQAKKDALNKKLAEAGKPLVK